MPPLGASTSLKLTHDWYPAHVIGKHRYSLRACCGALISSISIILLPCRRIEYQVRGHVHVHVLVITPICMCVRCRNSIPKRHVPV